MKKEIVTVLIIVAMLLCVLAESANARACVVTSPLASDVVHETFSVTPEYQAVATAEQSLTLNLSASQEDPVNYVTVNQDVLFGFTCTAKANPTVVAEKDNYHAEAGVTIDFELGLRLPVRITLEYPEQMPLGHDYTLYATLTPLDWSAAKYSNAGLSPDENEFLARFIAQANARVWADNFLGSRFTFVDISVGPYLDFSQSFTTPFGSTSFPIPSKSSNLIDVENFLTTSLELQPELGFNKITAEVSESGAASEQYPIEWSAPSQRIPITIHAADYDPTTNQINIKLSDFRYYINKFVLNISLNIDFHGDLVHWLSSERNFDPIDLSGLTQNLYLNVHEGTAGTVNIYAPISSAFGNTVLGAILDQNDPNAQSVSYFTAKNTGSVTDIVAYISGELSGKAVAALYAVSGGSAGALLAQSNSVNIGTSFSWVDFQLPTAYTVTSGTTYGLAVMGNVPVNIVIAAGTGQRTGGPGYGSFASGFRNPFGTVWFNDHAGAMSIYATGPTLSAFGNTLIGTGDQNDPNAQSVSYFTAKNTGSVTDIIAYVSGVSSGKAITALYAVTGNSAGALLEQSDSVQISATFSWVDFQLPTPYTVTAGTTYGLAIMGNVRINVMIVSGTGQRDHNALSSYANGFANQFGTVWGIDDRGAMSIYATG